MTAKEEAKQVITLPGELARRIGAAPPLPGEAAPEPQTKLDHAISWARQGLHVFPCKSWLGTPLVKNWWKVASHDPGQIRQWWSETPDADIAAVPSMSDHFVIAVIGTRGHASLEKLEEKYGELTPEFVTVNWRDDLHLWFRGEALTSHNLLGPGLHVMAAGAYVYLPPSVAPNPDWE
jgi:hypothetical protein